MCLVLLSWWLVTDWTLYPLLIYRYLLLCAPVLMYATICLPMILCNHDMLLCMLSSNLLRISAHLFGAPLPCPSPCALPGVFSLCPMDHLTVRTLWYFSRYFSHFSLPRNVLCCEGIDPHTFCFLSLIFDFVACATVQWLPLT